MSYQTPITIAKALEKIHRHEYVIPAIQREFVWDPDQMCRLFDSLLLRGYPIGTFLFGKVPAKQSKDYSFYDVVRDYHEVRNRHNAMLTIPVDQDVVAILDGQQRLTALNLGLQGSYTTKRKSSRGPSDLYVTRLLHLDLLHDPANAEELEAQFSFRFLTETDAAKESARSNPLSDSFVTCFRSSSSRTHSPSFGGRASQTRAPSRTCQRCGRLSPRRN